MNTQRPIPGPSISTHVTVSTWLAHGLVCSRCDVLTSEGTPNKILDTVWSLSYSACRHILKYSHNEFYAFSMHIEEAARMREWRLIKCADGCPLEIHLYKYFGADYSRIDL